MMITPGTIALVLSGCLLTSALATTGSAHMTQVVSQTAPPPDLATKALVEKACSDCHKFNMVSAQRKSADQWAASVKRMIEMGTVLPESEVPRVVAYLAENYGPAGPEKAAD
jgi:cytochrome c5